MQVTAKFKHLTFEQKHHEKKKKKNLPTQGDKTYALHIDLNCLTHEAAGRANGSAAKPAISRQRLPKAMKAEWGVVKEGRSIWVL